MTTTALHHLDSPPYRRATFADLAPGSVTASGSTVTAVRDVAGRRFVRVVSQLGEISFMRGMPDGTIYLIAS